MNALNMLRGWALLAAVMLAVAGCGGGGGGGAPAEQQSTSPPAEGGSGGEAADLGFTLSSFARTDTTGALSGGKVELNGQLLVVNLDTNTEETWDWALNVDPTAFRVDTQVTLNLEGGTYDFYFLLNGNGTSYAGALTHRLIITGENALNFTLHPVIVDGTVTVDTIRTLSPFSFDYDPSDVGTYDDPAFSVAVDGGTAHPYSINVHRDSTTVTVWLVPGEHKIAVKFYDGAKLKLVGDDNVDVPPPAPPEEEPTPPTAPEPTPEPTPIEVTPVQTAVTYTYTPTGSPSTDEADVTFVVPPVIVEEAGGLGTLQSTVSVVGPLTPLFESSLTLSQADANYEGSLTVPGFTSGPLTWSIQFRDTRDGQLFAYCAQSVTIPQTDQPVTETFICEPSVLARAEQPPEPPGNLTVDVHDPDAVLGAVVKANDETLGITGNGAGGEAKGSLDVFLPADSYPLKVVHQMLDPFGSGEVITRTGSGFVGLEPGGMRDVTITLPSLDQPIVPCVDGGQVKASKAYSPSKWLNGQCSVPAPLLVTISDTFTVTSGNVGNQWATLTFENKDGSRTVCMYQGNSPVAHPTPEEVQAQGWGTGYTLHGCYDAEPTQVPPELAANQLQLGDGVVVDGSIALKVNGDKDSGPTTVAWTIEAVPAPDESASEPLPEDETDVGEPPAEDGGDEDVTPSDYIRVTASRTQRPRRFFDGKTRIDGWAKVRIPGHDQLVVAPGDPDRFLMILYFGRGVKCWYMGGRWDSAVGGLLERFFRSSFSSPACTAGKRQGSTIWVRGPIKARVIAGNPREDTTQVVVDVPVVRWWNRDNDHDRRDQGRDRHDDRNDDRGRGNGHDNDHNDNRGRGGDNGHGNDNRGGRRD